MRLILSAAALILAGCVSTGLSQDPGDASIRGGVYTNLTYDIHLQFSSPEGWRFLTQAREIGNCGPAAAILCAANRSRLVDMVLTLEDGGFEMENEDYQTKAESELRNDWGDKIVDSSLASLRTKHGQALVWTYTIESDVLVQAFLKRGTQNLRLVFSVPEPAFPRRRQEILEIIQSVELGDSGSAKAAVSL